MKNITYGIPLVILLCFSFACRNKETMAELEKYRAQAELEEENKALALRYSEARSKGDIKAIKELLSPEYVWHISGGHKSLEESIEFLKQQMAM